MKPKALARLALSAFLMFAVLGLVSILIESSVKPHSWDFIAVQALAYGGIAAGIVLVRGRWWAVVLIVLFWGAIIAENGSGLSFVYKDGTGWRVRLEGSRQEAVQASPAERAVVLAPDQLDALYTQRSLIGAIAIFLLILGYSGFVSVIKNEVRQKARLETEIRIARDIQNSLLPAGSLETDKFSISGVTIPASEVGGDYYDFLELGDGKAAVSIADVTGHGVGAGILSAMVKSAMHLQLEIDPDPVMVLTNLNRALYDITDDKTFVTFAYALLDAAHSSLCLVTAGHPPGFLREGGSGSVLQIRSRNPALGMQRASEFSGEGMFRFGSGDLLILYTDGVTEASGPGGQQFGEEAFLKVVAEAEGSSRAVCAKIVEELRKFCRRDSFEDDISIICVRGK